MRPSVVKILSNTLDYFFAFFWISFQIVGIRRIINLII